MQSVKSVVNFYFSVSAADIEDDQFFGLKMPGNTSLEIFSCDGVAQTTPGSFLYFFEGGEAGIEGLGESGH